MSLRHVGKGKFGCGGLGRRNGRRAEYVVSSRHVEKSRGVCRYDTWMQKQRTVSARHVGKVGKRCLGVEVRTEERRSGMCRRDTRERAGMDVSARHKGCSTIVPGGMRLKPENRPDWFLKNVQRRSPASCSGSLQVGIGTGGFRDPIWNGWWDPPARKSLWRKDFKVWVVGGWWDVGGVRVGDYGPGLCRHDT